MTLLTRCLWTLVILLSGSAASQAGNGLVGMGRTGATWWWVLGIVVIVVIALALWRRRGRM